MSSKALACRGSQTRESHLGINFKKKFIPANIRHHTYPGEIFKPPVAGYLPEVRSILRTLYKCGCRTDVIKPCPFLADERLNLVESALNLSTDISRVKTHPGLINGSGA